MRTDPHPNEVRRIVERVFSDYLPPDRPRREMAATACDEGQSHGIPAFFASTEADFDEIDEIDPALPEIDESILIDEGRYVARSYRTQGYMAMWLVAVGIVQFYDEEGQMLATINLFESLRPQRMAA
jgi:hypothetical protein